MRQDKNEGRINLILILAVVASSLPLFFHGIEGHFGQDLGFHINRIEGIYLELSRGVFPVRMQSFWMEGYGYPVSIYYGDIFLYFPAVLRLLGVPVVAAYKIFLLSVNIITVMVSYFCFSRISGNRLLGALGSFVYATSNYRLLDLYIRAAVGEYTAMIFLPVVAYAVCLIYGWISDDNSGVAPLTVGMTGILLSHIMTLEVTGICLIVICVINIKKTLTKDALLTYIGSAALTLLISAYFVVPFLDYFTTESVRINEVVGNARQIQESGTRLYEFFDFFMIPFSNLDPSISDDRMLTTPGMVLMMTLIAGVAYCCAKRPHEKNRHIYGLTVASLVLLFVSSDMFPWNYLGRNSAIGDLLAQVQFPWRYVSIATVALTALLLSLIKIALLTSDDRPHNLNRNRTENIVCAIIISAAFAMCVWFSGVYGRYAQLDDFSDTADLDTYDMGFIEYLRPDAVREDFLHEIRVTAGDVEEMEELYRDGTSLDVYVRSDSGATIEFPVLNYKYYYVTDESEKDYELIDGENDEINVDIDAGFDGVLSLRFKPPILWHIAEWVSVIALAGFLIVIYRNRKTEGKIKNSG